MSEKNPKILAAAERLKKLFESQGKEKTVSEQAYATMQGLSVAMLVDQFSRSMLFAGGEPPAQYHVLGSALVLAKWAREAAKSSSKEDVSFKDAARQALEDALMIYEFNEQLANELTEEEKDQLTEDFYGKSIPKKQVDPNQN